MYRITLTDEQRRELRARTRRKDLAPSTRDRLEMVRLSDAGWSVPRIARHLGQHEHTVRPWIKAFLAGGFDALPNKPRGGKASALTAAMLESVRAEVARGRAHLDGGPTGGLGRGAPRRPPERRPPAPPPAPGAHLLAAHQPHAAAQTGPRRGRRTRGRARRTSQKRGCWGDRSVPSGRSGLCPDLADDLQLVSAGPAAARALSGAARAAGQRHRRLLHARSRRRPPGLPELGRAAQEPRQEAPHDARRSGPPRTG